jgi:hypothetical protein
VAEVEASAGYTPLEALTVSLDLSEIAFVLVLDGRVEAMWGVAMVEGHPPQVWLLGSDALTSHPLTLCRLARVEIRRLLEQYGALGNYVDERYETALRWARYLGFTVDAPEPFGPDGLPFCRIEMRRLPCAPSPQSP